MARDLLAEPVDLLAAEQPADDLAANMAAIEAARAAEDVEEPNTFAYLFNRLKKGAAGFMGAPGDILKMIRSQPSKLLPPPLQNPVISTLVNEGASQISPSEETLPTERVIATGQTYRDAFGVDPEMSTNRDWLRYAGGAVEMAGAGGPFGLATKARNLPALVTSIFGSGIGLEGGGDVAEGLGFDREAGEAVGAGLGGGISAVAPNAVTSTGSAIRRRFSADAQKASAESAVGREITEQIQSYPPAAGNIERSLQISDEIPGFSPSLPARSSAPGLLAEEKRLVAQSPKTLNKAVQTIEENQRAIQSYVEGKFPAVVGETAAARVARLQKQSVTRLEGMKAAIDEKLDDAVRVFERNPSNFENGQDLRRLFLKQKELYRGIRGQKYQDVYEAADRLGVKANIDDIVQYADDVLKNELNAYQASEIPPVFRMLSKEAADVPDDVKAFVKAQGGPSGEVSFAKLHSLLKRANGDIASLRGSQAVDRDFRMMLLSGLKTKLEAKVAAFEADGFGEVAVKLKEANRFHRGEYMPRFKQGFGSDIAARYSSGEFKTPDQLVTELITKRPNNTQAAKDFKLLFDDVPEAWQSLRSGYLDELYRNTGVIGKDGRISQKALDTFLRKHEPTLAEFPQIRKELRQLSLDNSALLQRRAVLVAAEKKLAAQDLFKLFQGKDPTVVLTEATTNKNAMRALSYQARRDPNMAKGLSRGIAEHVAAQPDPMAFLTANEEAIRIGLKPLGNEHFRNLKTAVEAMTINARNPAATSVAAGSVAPDLIAANLGSSPRAMISHYLNVQRGRTGAAQEATAFLGRWFDKLRRDHKTVAMEAVFYDKDVARALSSLAKNPESQKAQMDFATQMTSLGVRVEVAGQE